MDLFKSIKFYLWTTIAAAVTAWASHHPGVFPHDLLMWILGVIAHAIGVEQQKQIGNGGSAA